MGALGRLLGAEVGIDTVLKEVDNLITIVSAVIYSLAIMGLTIFAVYVGFKMAKAEDDGKRKEAKAQLIYSIIGLVASVALISMFTIVLPTIRTTTGNAGGTGNVALMANSVLGAIDLIMSSLIKIITLGASVLAMFVGWKMMSAEDDGKRKQAKTQLIYAIVGVIGVILINLLGTAAIGFIKPA